MDKNMKKIISCICTIILFLSSTIGFAFASGFSSNPDAINEKIKSVVLLKTFDENNNLLKSGSGFVLFDNRTLITNYHVIEQASLVLAESDEGYQYYLGGIIAADQEKDIAILQFMAPTIMTPLDYSLDDHQRGEPVVVVGSPQGLINNVSTGIISALYQDTQRWIQFTAPASHGSSGGPVFDDSGKVIGMTTWNLSEGQNMNFAIDIRDIVDLYKTWDGKTIVAIKDSASLGINHNSAEIISIDANSSVYYIVVGEQINLIDCITVTPADASLDDLEFMCMPPSIISDYSDNKSKLWYSSQECGEKIINVKHKDNELISTSFSIVVMPENGIMADVILDGGHEYGSNTDGLTYFSFFIHNPDYAKTIKGIEICIYDSDIWGTVLSKPTYATIEKTINTGTSEVYDILFDVHDLVAVYKKSSGIRYGISRVAYDDGTIISVEFNQIRTTYKPFNRDD